MTDKVRAVGLVHRIAGAQSGVAARDTVVADFAAVRAEERAAIVALLRRIRAQDPRPEVPVYAMLTACADSIERGEHTTGRAT